MPRKSKDGEPFDKVKYNNEWNASNMKRVSAAYKADFVDSFKAACQKLGITQSAAIRQMMEETIRKAEGDLDDAA